MPGTTTHYDVIGSGPGGGLVTHALASTGKRILILECGGSLPRRENGIFYNGDRVSLDLEPTNMEAHGHLRDALRKLVGRLDAHPHLSDRSLYLGRTVPESGTSHQAGTLVFGTDPGTSVLDLEYGVHGIDNPYVTDASYLPSIGAVNPTLTIVANALCVVDGIRWRLVA